MTSPPHEETGPHHKAGSSTKNNNADPRIQPIGDSPVSTGRRYWARQLIERQTPDRPQYGSTAWLMLPNDHPDKIAACVVAAEIHASRGDNLEAELRQEVELSRKAFKDAEDEAYEANWEAHKRRFPVARVVDSFTDRRARQLEAAKSRPDDFPGRGEGA